MGPALAEHAELCPAVVHIRADDTPAFLYSLSNSLAMRVIYIYRVHNTSDETAISIHVYGTDVTRVGSSARRYYN